MAFSFYRLKVLIWANIIALYTVWMTMPYLTDVWKLSLTHAAAIINVFWGFFYLTLFFFLFLVDTVTGNFWMLVLSSLSSSCGLGLLAMSTPPALYRITDTCKEYRPECIAEEQKILFYVALALIAAGMSGQLVSFFPFLTEQLERIADAQADTPTTNSLVFLVAIVLLYINQWSVRFGVQAICTVAATAIFLSGACSYRRVRPEGSPLTTVFRVVVAAASKILHRSPEDESRLYDGDGVFRIPHSRRLRVPIAILLWFHHSAKFQFIKNCLQVVKWIVPRRFNRQAPQIGVAVSIVFGVLCCIAAADVETRRLRAVERHGLVDKSEDRVPMTMFRLVPQFILMGCMEGTFWSCVSSLFDKKNISLATNQYLNQFFGGVIGGGFIGSILAVHVVGSVSSRNGKVSWFQDTLNESRLDKYYWTLAALSAAWLVVYVLVALCCSWGDPSDPAAGDEDEVASEPIDVEITCCGCSIMYSRN